MKHTVIRIMENTDSDTTAMVTLKGEDGKETQICQSKQILSDRDIKEGDAVIFDENRQLQKPLTGDWTKSCTMEKVDALKFTEMMFAVKSGKQIDWICPFCGGKVVLMEQEEGHTVMGCNSCDMRINLDLK